MATLVSIQFCCDPRTALEIKLINAKKKKKRNGTYGEIASFKVLG